MGSYVNPTESFAHYFTYFKDIYFHTHTLDLPFVLRIVPATPCRATLEVMNWFALDLIRTYGKEKCIIPVNSS